MPVLPTPQHDHEWLTIPAGMLITPLVGHMFRDEDETLHLSFRHVMAWGRMKRDKGSVIGLFLDPRSVSNIDHGTVLVHDGLWVQQLETYP